MYLSPRAESVAHDDPTGCRTGEDRCCQFVNRQDCAVPLTFGECSLSQLVTSDGIVLASAVLSEKALLRKHRARHQPRPEQQLGTTDLNSWKLSVADRKRIFFPDPPRELPAERTIRTTLRTAHIAAFGILLGGHVFDVDAERLRFWLWLTLATGGLFVALELYGSFVWLQELRGWLTMFKLLLLGLVPFCWTRRIWLLLSVVVIGSLCSHMPGRFRYYSVRDGCQVGEERRG